MSWHDVPRWLDRLSAGMCHRPLRSTSSREKRSDAHLCVRVDICVHISIYIYIYTYIDTYIHTIPYHTIPYHTIPYHYITLHYITLHYITLHYITLHYITLHYIHIVKYDHACNWKKPPPVCHLITQMKDNERDQGLLTLCGHTQNMRPAGNARFRVMYERGTTLSSSWRHISYIVLIT